MRIGKVLVQFQTDGQVRVAYLAMVLSFVLQHLLQEEAASLVALS